MSKEFPFFAISIDFFFSNKKGGGGELILLGRRVAQKMVNFYLVLLNNFLDDKEKSNARVNQ